MLDNMIVVVNAEDTSDWECAGGCSTWKEHWKKNTRQGWPEICSAEECDKPATDGAHVIDVLMVDEAGMRPDQVVTPNLMSIVPTCEGCNHRGDMFFVPRRLMIPARELTGCQHASR